MIVNYDYVATQVNQICTCDCWKNPKTDCPYYCVCEDEALTQSPDVYERTRAFEERMIMRYKELHPEVNT